MATLRGEAVDRPALSFYELNGLDENPNDPDPFNIYSHPSWKPLLDLTREKTDRIVLRGVAYASVRRDPLAECSTIESFERDGSRFYIQQIRAGARTLTARARRDRDVNTVWTEEHLLKDTDDLRAFRIQACFPSLRLVFQPLGFEAIGFSLYFLS